MNQPKKITPVPIHFKKPGRSYSQIGRKGNVALYSVYSDYLIIPDFALPYLLIGYELVCIKTNRNGVERYPRDEEFGASAWSIPKSFSRSCTPRSRCRVIGPPEFRVQKPNAVPDRSASSEDSARSAVAIYRDESQAWQTN